MTSTHLTRLAQLAQQWRPVAPDPEIEFTPGPEPMALPLMLPLVLPESATSRQRMPAMDTRSWRLLIAFAAVALLVIGWLWVQGRPQSVQSVSDTTAAGSSIPGSPASLSPSSTSSPLTGEVVVHVAGDVRKPGLQHLPVGSRVADAIHAAGGVSNSKAENSVNLARVLIDGEQIMVGVGPQQASSDQQYSSAQGSGSPIGKVSVNSASQQQLETLPGVGPSLAQRILEYRIANGAFHSIDELDEVSGIGPATLARLRPLIQL
ncbi:MAG: helix-hairpin-helix domain-containing protein [Actinomycetes bacterium]